MAVAERSSPGSPRLWHRPAVVAGGVLAAVLAVLGVLAIVTRPAGEPPALGPGDAVPVADPVDVGFATDMLDHHQQALQMSLLAIDKATTTPVQTLAIKMVTGQQSESGRFLQYLEERGLHQGDPDRVVMGWMGMARPRAQMPGLASPGQLVALTNASGPDVDRQFLDLMIRHHEGGLHMAEHAAEHGRNEPLRGVAARMVVTQRREIADMQQLQQGLR